MDELVERLEAHCADIANWNGDVHKRWDSWRSYIAEGGVGSWPRDAFESVLDSYAEDMEAATRFLRASAKREKRFREALEKIAFGPPHEGEVKHVLNTLVEIAQLALKEA